MIYFRLSFSLIKSTIWQLGLWVPATIAGTELFRSLCVHKFQGIKNSTWYLKQVITE